MADNKKDAAISFDEIIKAGRKKKENERLAQEILGKRRSSTPSNAKKSGLGGSLASRVGVTKRPTSLSRSQSSQSRLPPARVERDAPRQNQRQTQPHTGKNNANSRAMHENSEVSFAGKGVSIKGAAGGPYIVVASNFAEGTTAEDIKSVMISVGGAVTSCRLVASSPTVIAEISFRDRSGAESVISTFNNKKADGRLLYVSFKGDDTQSIARTDEQSHVEPLQVQADYDGDETMEIDENAKSREAEDKLREERRGGGRDDRGRQDAFPNGPRNNRAFGPQDDYYYNNNNRQPAYQQGGYQDGRYGYGGYSGRGRYHDDQRGYRGRGGGQWR